MFNPRCVILLVCLPATIAVCGCGSQPSLYPASGKVVYDDGSPMPGGATLIFESTVGAKGRIEGTIQNDGTFALSTMDKRGDILSGAPTGTYRVYIVPSTYDPGGDQETVTREVTTEKYGNPETSGIQWEIKPMENTEILIRVEKPQPTRAM